MEQQPGDSAMVKAWGKGYDCQETLTEDRSQPPLPPGFAVTRKTQNSGLDEVTGPSLEKRDCLESFISTDF